MDNQRAVELQKKIIRLTDEWNRTNNYMKCNQIQAALERACDDFERELMWLIPELKELDENGYIIPNSRKSLIRNLIK